MLIRLSLCLLFAAVLPLAAGDAKPAAVQPPSVHQALILIDYVGTAAAASYEKATASEPLFTDKALWPNLAGKEAYVSETWKPGRTLVWAKPGSGGEVKANKDKLSCVDPANWLENGKPATEVWDENTSIVLPRPRMGSATRSACVMFLSARNSCTSPLAAAPPSMAAGMGWDGTPAPR